MHQQRAVGQVDHPARPQPLDLVVAQFPQIVFEAAVEDPPVQELPLLAVDVGEAAGAELLGAQQEDLVIADEGVGGPALVGGLLGEPPQQP
ncbi:hypothetical protein, partial [Glycomyces tenuis]|uniref:hypothetical protein n=1 Tax=Glycomyces tenuis TaxID=58116 RepID=UPI00138E3FEC